MTYNNKDDNDNNDNDNNAGKRCDDLASASQRKARPEPVLRARVLFQRAS